VRFSRLLGLGSALLVLTAPGLTPARAAELCLQGDRRAAVALEVPALAVSVSADRATYRRGETALVPVQVRLGVAKGPTSPAAQVTVVIRAGGHVVKELSGQTEPSGTAPLHWKIGVRVPTGTLTAVATASLLAVDSFDCSGGLVYLTGQGQADPLTTVGA
jgi:hypothetical protein